MSLALLELAPTECPEQAVVTRLLAGPAPAAGNEDLDDHRRRLLSCPQGGRWLLDTLESSGLRGRGGASFPTWRKWEAVAQRSQGHAVVVVNASEGEPLSSKDRRLLAARPHLVLDGAALAAATVGADEIVVYLARGFRAVDQVIRRALRERRKARLPEPPISIVRTAHRYVAGEASAVVRRLEGGPAKPQLTPPRAFERGVNNRPTLVQNAETLAHVALIARFGSSWFRELGTVTSPGTALMTLTGNVARPGVYEVDLEARLGGVLDAAGGTTSPPAGALIGGYFGTWLPASSLAELPLDEETLRREYGGSLGCGVLAVLPAGACGITEAARILGYLAAESAGQCGPCVNGLSALSETMDRIVAGDAVPTDVDRVRRWAGLVRGRGACHHPDGAVDQLTSALTVFADHLGAHLVGVPCPGTRLHAFASPGRARGWR